MPDPDAQMSHLTSALAERYRIEREVGRGGMATVYLADDLRHRRKVAIKVLRPELAQALGTERFLREIQLTASLDHPHILPLLDSGEAAGYLYYTMPYVEGESLRDRLDREKQVPIDDALAITEEVADALGYAHSRGVIHRDIKPENILLAGGHARVADFGIATALAVAGGERLTETGITVGTPLYMSPEQGAGAEEVDGRSDIYSLGCVLYEMLAGQPPFTGPSVHAILARHSLDPVPRMRTVRQTVSEGLEATLLRALAKVPADRFSTASGFAEALTATAPPRKPTWRRVAVVGALVLTGGVAWWAFTQAGHASPRIDSIAVLPLENLSGDPEQEYFVEGMYDAIITQLAQISALKVTSRTSAELLWKRGNMTVRELARELGVAAVLEGSVLAAEGRVRITVQLIEGSADRHLWAASYERDLGGVLALQSQVAQAVAEEIRVTLTPDEEARLAAERRVNPEAFTAYARAKFLLNRMSPESFMRALALLEAAIEADSTWAAPYAALANWYTQSFFQLETPWEEAAFKAREAVARALQLDSTLPEAYFELGSNQLEDWDWGAAEQALRRGLALRPNSAEGHHALGSLLGQLGRYDEAIGHARRAVELDPISNFPRDQLVLVLQLAGRYEEAAAEAREALALDPDYSVGYYRLAWALFGAGKHDEAVASIEQGFQRFASKSNPLLWKSFLAEVYAYTGRERQARELLPELLESDPKSWAAAIANIYNGLGDNKEALKWFWRAYDLRSGAILYFMMLPRARRIRAEPEFQELVRRLDLPETAMRQLEPQSQ